MTSTGELLRTAARHVREYGWRRKSFGNRSQGMCLHGGLYSAVIEANQVEYTDYPYARRYDVVDVIGGCSEAERITMTHQGDVAVTALDKVVPPVPGCSACVLLRGTKAAANARVYHYNDEHCTGGEDAALLLEQAAEKWEADR